MSRVIRKEINCPFSFAILTALYQCDECVDRSSGVYFYFTIPHEDCSSIALPSGSWTLHLDENRKVDPFISESNLLQFRIPQTENLIRLWYLRYQNACQTVIYFLHLWVTAFCQIFIKISYFDYLICERNLSLLSHDTVKRIYVYTIKTSREHI